MRKAVQTLLRLVGEEAHGETGRLGSAIESIEAVCETLDVEVERH